MLEYRNAAGTIIARTDDATGHVEILEPEHPDWTAAVAAEPAPYVEPPPAPDPLPQVVSRFQARAALHMTGKLAAAEAAVAGSGNALAQLAWADAQEFHRTSPTIAALAPALQLTAADVDDLFRLAATIEA